MKAIGRLGKGDRFVYPVTAVTFATVKQSDGHITVHGVIECSCHFSEEDRLSAHGTFTLFADTTPSLLVREVAT
jgi:hypothetical protein